MPRALTLPLLACVSLALAACASADGAYPSLAKRPAERITATWPPAPPPPPPAPPPLDPAKRDKLDLLLAEVRGADARFNGKEARARSLVGAARGAAMGSESWSVATVAVSELEAARAQAMVAMAELDSLYAEARITGLDVAPIEATRQQAVAIISGQDRVLDSLKGALDR
jgi:hypothetical protein